MLDQKPTDNTYSVLRNKRTSKIPPKLQVISQCLGIPEFTKSGIQSKYKKKDEIFFLERAPTHAVKCCADKTHTSCCDLSLLRRRHVPFQFESWDLVAQHGLLPLTCHVHGAATQVATSAT